jgi:DNA-binding MarR family transcriptional regulator
MEERLIEHFRRLRTVGRLYTMEILDGNLEDETDLKLSHINVLSAFSGQSDLSMKELAKSIGVKRPNMTMMVDSLVAAGFLMRERDENDRRKVMVMLTPTGRIITKKIAERKRTAALKIFAKLTEDEKKRLETCLNTACEILEKAVEV